MLVNNKRGMSDFSIDSKINELKMRQVGISTFYLHSKDYNYDLSAKSFPNCIFDLKSCRFLYNNNWCYGDKYIDRVKVIIDGAEYLFNDTFAFENFFTNRRYILCNTKDKLKIQISMKKSFGGQSEDIMMSIRMLILQELTEPEYKMIYV